MSFMPGYKPKVPDEKTVASLSGDVTKNIFASLFEEAMPDVHKSFNSILGVLGQSVEGDFDLQEEINKIQINNQDAVNIFLDYVLPEYERMINEEEVGLVSDNGESNGERAEELVQGNEGIN